MVVSLLSVYEKLFYCGDKLEDYIFRRLDEEKLDYIKHEWSFNRNFSLIYAAEIDRGNQAVINAIRDLILSENNTAYLDREMILGILRSDNRELQKLLGDLLLAARLQEGLRQVICEAMDEGTKEAFLILLHVIEANDLIRYSSVKRAVSTWIGIFDEKSVDRVNGKLLNLMSQCLRDRSFCCEQLKTNDSIAMIAKYTPLSAEELQDGAFDIDWFREAYSLLGEKNFGLLYKAAKYISDGQKHSRARKYADAATGKVTLDELREQITAKRNKDLLMSYGLVPFGEDQETDMLARYQFIQKYAKEARQFGAQRRASESKAAEIALVNMSVHAGFADVTRLTLRMESRLARKFAPYMAWNRVDGTEDVDLSTSGQAVFAFCG